MTTIPTYDCKYDETEEKLWKANDPATLAKFLTDQQRFLYSRRSSGGWFLEALVTRHLYRLEYNVWHELYQLVTYKNYKQGVWRENTEELRPLLGSRRHDALIAEFQGAKFSNPNVIGYHPQLERFAFIEAKRGNESFQPNQEASLLALMKHFPDAVVAVVRFWRAGYEEIEISELL